MTDNCQNEWRELQEAFWAKNALPTPPDNRAPAGRCTNYDFKVWSQEPNAPGFEHYDTDGQPIITSKKQIAEACAKGDLMYGDGNHYGFMDDHYKTGK